MSIFKNTFVTAYRSKLYPNMWDVLAFVLVFSLIAIVAWAARQMITPYQVGETLPISLNAAMLPYYAARTVVRMFLALFFSLLFTFTIGTWAAKSYRASRIIIPMIDILQSLPILGFLSISVAPFIALFPGSMLGPECAAVFAIFTSQAWNMALGFYQTIRSVPNEVNEAGRMLHLNAWQRFWRIDVPYSMPGLLWNTMASMSAGWFFVVASEAITVSNQEILLPGIGSYIAVAIKAANMQAITYAVIAMFIVIVIYDQVLFRPLVAWADKFKSTTETAGMDEEPESWVMNFFRRTRTMRWIGSLFKTTYDWFVALQLFKPRVRKHVRVNGNGQEAAWVNMLWSGMTFVLVVGTMSFLIYYVVSNFNFHELEEVFFLGLVTTLRVFILIALSSLVWVPIGIWIGLRPTAAKWAQPIAQILAAFPANLFYPFIVIFIVTYHLNPNIWLTPLMILGAQWYILFNVIAGATTIPKDLMQAVDNMGASGWLRWKKLLLPAIFPYYVTGAITAAGGAWNASIVAEVASWGNETLVATGLGAYIAEYTAKGEFAQITLGIGMMCGLVLFFNWLVWRPLYHYAETRFVLE